MASATRRLRVARKANPSDTSRSPNRTSDDAPMTEETARRTDIRNPLKAPGQFPPYARRKTHLDADESYGSTEIPHRKDSRSNVTKPKRAIKRVPAK